MACCNVPLSTVLPTSISLRPLSRYGHFCRSIPPRRKIVFATDQQPDANPVSLGNDAGKEDLAAKLAAAEAEAAALRKELAARSNKEVDLARLKPATPEKRIDGTGFRETLFTGMGTDAGKPEKQPNSWGLSEAELFLSKGAPTESSSLAGSAGDVDTENIVRRRLLVGLGITVIAVGLSFLKFPPGLLKPSKPLFFYLVPIIRLYDQLVLIEKSTSDVNTIRKQLQQALSPQNISKDTFLSAAGWLKESDADKAVNLTFVIFDYLNQADYNKYFESLGTPSAAQQLEFLKFSLRSVQAARENLEAFLALMPPEDLAAAKNNVQSVE